MPQQYQSGRKVLLFIVVGGEPLICFFSGMTTNSKELRVGWCNVEKLPHPVLKAIN
ncbi:unnamed protein product [Dovyalis caffra]|uniref:Uncharacterized protein n=1 Tax=Dovyalis caffra TaxID=77055 RepID=A0AAV1RSI7_9ROSI|nr:unnamed protein product [Dovyalis caffra]